MPRPELLVALSKCEMAPMTSVCSSMLLEQAWLIANMFRLVVREIMLDMVPVPFAGPTGPPKSDPPSDDDGGIDMPYPAAVGRKLVKNKAWLMNP